MLGDSEGCIETVEREIALIWIIPESLGLLERSAFEPEACTARLSVIMPEICKPISFYLIFELEGY
jgi:hypothetical protein